MTPKFLRNAIIVNVAGFFYIVAFATDHSKTVWFLTIVIVVAAYRAETAIDEAIEKRNELRKQNRRR